MEFGRKLHHYHAPWSRWFRTFYVRGNWVHEVQIGPFVIQVRRRNKTWKYGWLHVWKTEYWR